MKIPILYIVVPCYNEADCLNETTKRLGEKLNALIKQRKIANKSKVVYIDDGSKDKTWEKIEGYGDNVIGVKLSRNRGHQNALLAGLIFAKEHADVVISMDADLQDDINAIDKMLEKFAEGNEIVYGVRKSRKKDTWFKRNTAQGFYRIMNFLGAEMVYNSADYRLMSKRVLEELTGYEEVNLFLRGIVPLIGFKSTTVEYERGERFAGNSKYPLKKMLSFAWEGVTSFSVKPIRAILSLGLIVMLVSVVMLVYALVRKITGEVVDGWTFVVCSIWLLGGVQMLSLGLIGEYIGKMYAEVKHRPRYIVEKITMKNI